MVNLDTETVLAAYVVSSAITTLVIFTVWRQNRKRFAGTGYWLACFLMQSLGVLLLSLRGGVPALLSTVLGNGLFMVGAAYLLFGLERFVLVRGRWLPPLVLCAAFIIVEIYFTVASPSLEARNINFSVCLSALCAMGAWTMLGRVGPEIRRITLPIGLIMIAYCAASLLRIIADLTVPVGNDFLHSNIFDTLLILAYQMLSIALTFGLLLMVNRRLTGELVSDIAMRMRVEEILFLRLSLWEYAASHSIEDLMQRALDGIQGILGSPIGFYHFVDEDQRNLSLQAWSTRTLKEYCVAEGRGMHYSLDRAGVWADCVRERRPIVHNDYESLPNRKGLPEGHARLVRELVVPTLRGGRVVSVLGVGNKPVEYDDKDVELLSSVADIVWTIIDRKRTEDRITGLQAQLREMAVRDSLTGLFNRHYLRETMKRELARAAREARAVAFIMIDIDHFKQVNDALGHAAGDAVLKNLADLLTRNSRAGDTVYRYGGEEFLAILPGVDADSAFQIAEKWRMGFEGSAARKETGGADPTISCGISVFPRDGAEGEALILAADKALYAAKEAGRNRSLIYRAACP